MNAVTQPANVDLSADERIVTAVLGKGQLMDADLQRAQCLQDEIGGRRLTLLGRLGCVSERATTQSQACAATTAA